MDSYLPTEQPLIKVEHAEFGYNEEPVLSDVNFRLMPGEIAAIMGASGVGKSTFVRLCSGFVTLKAGSLQVLGKDIPTGKSSVWSQLRPEIGIVFQELFLFSYRSALENIMEGPRWVLKKSKAEARELAVRVSHKLGIEGLLNRFPHELSGGERQRVAIARAMIMRPRVLLADEVTTGLDPRRAASIGRLICSIADEGIGVVLTSHQAQFVQRFATSVTYLHDGRVCESGPASILAEPTTDEFRHFVGDSLMSP